MDDLIISPMSSALKHVCANLYMINVVVYLSLAREFVPDFSVPER